MRRRSSSDRAAGAKAHRQVVVVQRRLGVRVAVANNTSRVRARQTDHRRLPEMRVCVSVAAIERALVALDRALDVRAARALRAVFAVHERRIRHGHAPASHIARSRTRRGSKTLCARGDGPLGISRTHCGRCTCTSRERRQLERELDRTPSWQRRMRYSGVRTQLCPKLRVTFTSHCAQRALEASSCALCVVLWFAARPPHVSNTERSARSAVYSCARSSRPCAQPAFDAPRPIT